MEAHHEFLLLSMIDCEDSLPSRYKVQDFTFLSKPVGQACFLHCGTLVHHLYTILIKQFYLGLGKIKIDCCFYMLLEIM